MPPSRLKSVLVLLIAAVAGAAVLAGCGDEDSDSETSGQSTSTSDAGGGTTTIGEPAPGADDVAPKGTIEAKVRVQGGGGGDRPTTGTVEVASDDKLTLKAELENTDQEPVVAITIQRGPASALEVTLGSPDAAEPVSTVTLQSSAGEIQVEKLTYTCKLPPETFCPVQTIQSKTAYEFRMVPGKDVAINLDVGLEPGAGAKPKPKPAK